MEVKGTDSQGRPPAVQLGLLWGAAAVSAAALVVAAPAFLSRFAVRLPRCVVKSATGFPCPACGSGRATMALARLDLVAALRANPLFTASAIAFAAGGLVALALAFAGRGVREPRAFSLAVRLAIVLAVAANWGWLVFDGR